MTYELPWVAIRHDSEIVTPLFQGPLISLSVRELAYAGAFALAAAFSAVGTLPAAAAAAAAPLLAVAFFKWRGEVLETYAYYAGAALLARAAARRGPGKRREKGGGCTVEGPGTEWEGPAGAAPEGPEAVKVPRGAPADLTLDLGAGMAHRIVTVYVDGRRAVRDAANGEGRVTVTVMPEGGGGARTFAVRDDSGRILASREVEFVG